MQQFRSEKLTQMGQDLFGDVLKDICYIFDDYSSTEFQKNITNELTKDSDLLEFNGIEVQIEFINGKIVFIGCSEWGNITNKSNT
jgi:hypothetical protein